MYDLRKMVIIGSSFILFFLFPVPSWANTSHHQLLDLTNHWVGYLSILIFIAAYVLVMTEEFTHLRKSKPVVLAAGLIWILIAIEYAQHTLPHIVEDSVRRNLLEYAELFLFLLVAMTYVNAMVERGVFEALRSWLVRKRFSYRQLFWITGIIAFFLSSVLDNLTTALIMCAVILAVGVNSIKFVNLSCINIVVAANAGGAFSPFGDITSLMVWQRGLADFWTFFVLFIPSTVNFVVPAAFMHFAIPTGLPELAASDKQATKMKRGAKRIVLAFALTIVTAVTFHNYLDMPSTLGMMTGLAYLQFLGYFLRKTHPTDVEATDEEVFDIFQNVSKAEWDTLLFFYGVVMCVGGLGHIGYLTHLSQFIYQDLGATAANVFIGIISAFVDNIPIMFSVLEMKPQMPVGQWMLVTLTAGVGGSILSIGSAAGVALMGQARGQYTFFSHLRWAPAIILGYAASIIVHLWLNKSMF